MIFLFQLLALWLIAYQRMGCLKQQMKRCLAWLVCGETGLARRNRVVCSIPFSSQLGIWPYKLFFVFACQAGFDIAIFFWPDITLCMQPEHAIAIGTSHTALRILLSAWGQRITSRNMFFLCWEGMTGKQNKWHGCRLSDYWLWKFWKKNMLVWSNLGAKLLSLKSHY